MTKTFRLAGLGCANCAAKMERAINKLEGVKNATVNFLTSKLIIEADEEKMEQILESSRAIITKIEPECVVK